LSKRSCDFAKNCNTTLIYHRAAIFVYITVAQINKIDLTLTSYLTLTQFPNANAIPNPKLCVISFTEFAEDTDRNRNRSLTLTLTQNVHAKYVKNN